MYTYAIHANPMDWLKDYGAEVLANTKSLFTFTWPQELIKASPQNPALEGIWLTMHVVDSPQNPECETVLVRNPTPEHIQNALYSIPALTVRSFILHRAEEIDTDYANYIQVGNFE